MNEIFDYAGKKVLCFEGAGAVPRGEVENCRIRTAFSNDEGKRFYLEILGFERNGHRWCEANSPRDWAHVGYIDFAYEITDGDDDDCNCHSCDCERNCCIEYTYKGILDFVNDEFGCSFDIIHVAGSLDGYHVFPEHRGYKAYNFGDEFEYSDEIVCRALSIRRHIEQKDDSKASTWNDDGILHARYYSGDKRGQHWIYMLDQLCWKDGILLNP
ncbi:hypothetical protein KQI08_11295 [Paraeggerthella hongkongensis]|uniref:hypothetical protein n=1 Tax=Paraeggerthella hominis TaxID=2897351 RepID=UPI001C114A5C|nr:MULTISPECIES: hypothetical protein [Paraeggerthella]MBU5406483.1 hypothetical protein [Paraeggerthella hongkongensis]MCD2434249.1 hypothetical protein [Paraeggerthella hominis]